MLIEAVEIDLASRSGPFGASVEFQLSPSTRVPTALVAIARRAVLHDSMRPNRLLDVVFRHVL